MITSIILSFTSNVVLIPPYYFGGHKTSIHHISKSASNSFFTQMTAHNIDSTSPLLYLQLPIWIVMAVGLTSLFVTVHIRSGRERYSWHSNMSYTDRWTLFFRNLPRDLGGAEELHQLLENLYPHATDYIGKDEDCWSFKYFFSERRFLLRTSGSGSRSWCYYHCCVFSFFAACF